MNEESASVFRDNDDFIDKYLHNATSFTDTARSVKIVNPLSGDSDTVPNVTAQLIHEYMWAKSNQEFLGNLLQQAESPVPFVLSEQAVKAVDRFRNTAYALHKVIMEIHANNYMDEDLGIKLAALSKTTDVSPDADKERYVYLDQFVFEYRRGDRVPNSERLLASKEDSDLFERMLDAMERYEIFKGLHEDALKEPELTPDDAINKARMMGTKERDVGKVASELLQNDSNAHGGISRIVPSFRFLELLDKVNTHRLILPSEDILRKLETSEQKNADLQSIINGLKDEIKQCKNDFEAYKRTVRPLGGGKTETGGTDEAPVP